jgi:type VI protein secretion system component VasK|tara:strand:+ start:20 stop:301 length:282 start_codon:yes stop_codon:yes gene_type:complete
MSDENSQEWHLSKSVPLTFVVGIFLQTIALVWYVSSLDHSIQNNEKELLRQDTRLNTIEQTVQSQALTLARIDENIKSIRIMMENISRIGDPR